MVEVDVSEKEMEHKFQTEPQKYCKNSTYYTEEELDINSLSLSSHS